MAVSGFLSLVIVFLILIVSISFFTLLERKVLGYAQLRKGPNKVGILGLLQPFSDAIKLFTKELNLPSYSNRYPFLFSPVASLFLALLLWIMYVRGFSVFYINFRVLLFLCISRLRVYGRLIGGWMSNSKYALLGAIRRVAQTISYEVSIALIILRVLLIFERLRFIKIYSYKFRGVLFIMVPLFLVWVTTVLAETNRTPFDFSEGESELVSGFNTEYRRVTFAIIFIAEYLNILAISIFTSVLFMEYFFFGSRVFKDIILFFYTMSLSFIIIWVRGRFPRMRYDLLINLTWKRFLPFSLAMLIVVIPLVITL